jgi:hypothetical protein
MIIHVFYHLIYIIYKVYTMTMFYNCLDIYVKSQPCCCLFAKRFKTFSSYKLKLSMSKQPPILSAGMPACHYAAKHCQSKPANADDHMMVCTCMVLTLSTAIKHS